MKRREEIHVSSGLGWIFTMGGTKAIEHKIDSKPWGADAEHHFHWQMAGITDGIIARRDEYGDEPLVIFCAMSWGNLVMQRACQRMAALENPVRVAYFAAIDPTALAAGMDPMLIPNTVEFVDEFWSTKWFFNFPYAARKRAPDGSAGGMLTFPATFPKENRRRHLVPTGHIGTARHPITTSTILEKIGELVG